MSGTFSCETLPVFAWCDVEDWTILDRLCRPLGWLSVTRKKTKGELWFLLSLWATFVLCFFFSLMSMIITLSRNS
jgi:hypothetical protein